jgi:mono/diheme cytochrome c family protein
MKILQAGIGFAASLLLGFMLLSSAKLGAKSYMTPRPERQQFQQLIHSVEGPDLFRAYCAPCHGWDAKGHGPVAPALKAEVPDLTVLAANNRGQFPTDRVRRFIEGEDTTTAHGSREMPIWGPIFHQVEADVDWGNVRMENLVKYLQSIQAVTPAFPLSGAELYEQHCAACHGNNLKGDGPAPPSPYRNPPDLTTLARRHGGKFPEAYVMNAIKNGVPIPAHGLAEMPIWGSDFKAPEVMNLTNYIKSAQEK